MTARKEFDAALLKLAADGRRPPCGELDDHYLWTSDEPAERAIAAKQCAGCPVIKECAATADAAAEKWHVWGGKDRTTKPRKARAA